MVVLDADERILYERRGESGLWGTPSGAAEPGLSFASIAVAEQREEVGLIDRPLGLESTFALG